MKANSTFRNALSEIPKDVSLQVGWSFGISDKIDARIKEFQEWNGESEFKTEMNIIFKMIEV